jgi:glycosyl transferase, family 25
LHVYLINPDRTPDRMAAFKAANAHLTELTRVPALDGETLDIASLTQQGLASEDVLTTYSRPAVALALSHVALWDRLIASGETMTIAEDDAVFHLDYTAHAAATLKALPGEWDFILWGFGFERFVCFDMIPGASTCLAQFEQDRLRAGIPYFQNAPVTPQPFRLVWAFGTPCYTISAKGARALKSLCLPLRPRQLSFALGARVPPHAVHYRTVGLDILLNLACSALDAFVCIPPLVVAGGAGGKAADQAGG